MRRSFELKIKPPTATAQQKGETIRNGYIHHYKKKNVKEAEYILKQALWQHIPKEPIMKEPIALICEWRFARNKAHKYDEWKTTRPDTDNMQKMLKDVMTELGFWRDDALVCFDVSIKKWVDEEQEGIKITYCTL